MKITFGLELLAMVALTGCSSFWKTATDIPSTNEASVAQPADDHETLPNGCVSSIAELSLPHYVSSDDERLDADRLIVVRKNERRVMLFSERRLRHDRPGVFPSCWHIALGWNPLFDKIMEGDGRTPEGWFRTSDKPSSRFYNAIRIHYPGERHAIQAYNRRIINEATRDRIVTASANGSIPPQNTLLGGEILLHGGGSSSDWTAGCVALSNQDVDELRSVLPRDMRTWILILP